MRVCDYFGLKEKDGLIGMEIEVEGHNLPSAIPYYWLVTKDGSLRGESFEYVFKKPYSPAQVVKAIDTLNKCFAESQLNFSHRCSVHVHINVLDLSRNELINFIYLSYFFDRFLSRIGGREITGNRFCLPIADAEGSVYHFEKMCKKAGNFYIPELQAAKYAAVNIVPVSKYGSVEFRMMRGTADPVLLKDWVAMLTSIYKYSLQFGTIKEMMEGFLDDGEKFCQQVFGKELFERFSNKFVLDDLRYNYSILISAMHETEYDKEEKQAPKPAPFDVIIDEYVDNGFNQGIADLVNKYIPPINNPIGKVVARNRNAQAKYINRAQPQFVVEEREIAARIDYLAELAAQDDEEEGAPF